MLVFSIKCFVINQPKMEDAILGEMRTVGAFYFIVRKSFISSVCNVYENNKKMQMFFKELIYSVRFVVCDSALRSASSNFKTYK